MHYYYRCLVSAARFNDRNMCANVTFINLFSFHFISFLSVFSRFSHSYVFAYGKQQQFLFVRLRWRFGVLNTTRLCCHSIKTSETESCDVANTFWVLFSASWCLVRKIRGQRVFCIHVNRRPERLRVWMAYGIFWNLIKRLPPKAYVINGISRIWARWVDSFCVPIVFVLTMRCLSLLAIQDT